MDGQCASCPHGQGIINGICDICPEGQIITNGTCESCPNGQIFKETPLIGSFDVGGLCPSPTYKYTEGGVDNCCCDNGCCWSNCGFSTPPIDCIQGIPDSAVYGFIHKNLVSLRLLQGNVLAVQKDKQTLMELVLTALMIKS